LTSPFDHFDGIDDGCAELLRLFGHDLGKVHAVDGLIPGIVLDVSYLGGIAADKILFKHDTLLARPSEIECGGEAGWT